MCGIIGYIGSRQATPLLVGGLRKLEYRGYDSAGVSVFNDGLSRVVRCRGKLGNLEEKLTKEPAPGTVGIGHTRWATHGRPSDENSHPHKVGPISVIHNGIIENHLQLRQELVASGSHFSSETDTEIFAHLVERQIVEGAENLTIAVRKALQKVRGSYAFVVMSDKEPGTLVAAKNSSPLVVGLGEGENFIASDVTAILAETRKVIFIEEGEMVTVTRDKVEIILFIAVPPISAESCRECAGREFAWCQRDGGSTARNGRAVLTTPPRPEPRAAPGRAPMEQSTRANRGGRNQSHLF